MDLCEFKASHGYTVRPCLKAKEITKQMKQKEKKKEKRAVGTVGRIVKTQEGN